MKRVLVLLLCSVMLLSGLSGFTVEAANESIYDTMDKVIDKIMKIKDEGDSTYYNLLIEYKDEINIETLKELYKTKLTNELKSTIESIYGDVEAKLDNLSNAEIEELKRKINDEVPSYDDDNGGYTGGGGGGVIPPPGPEEPEEPEVEEPEVEDGKIELGKDATEVKQGTEGQSIVTVKEANMTEATDALVKAIKEDAKLAPKLTIKLEDVKTLAMEVSISKNSLDKLAENNIELTIESEALTYTIQADALKTALKNAPQGSYVEFVSSIVEEADAEDLIKDEFAGNVAKTIEMNILIKDSTGKVINTIDKFDKKIKIAIEIEAKDGNPDLLGVFHIHERTGALEFVGGKVKRSKIHMSIDHYSKFAVIEYDKSFIDIENHWSKYYVKSMIAKHIIDGFSDENLYKPEDQLTRAQFAKLLVEALELDKVTYKAEFKDISTSHWSKDYVATAKQLGIIAGYDDGTFRPDQSITRSEMAVMLTNSLGLKKNSNMTALNKFKDVEKIPGWAVEYMLPVVQEELLVGSNGILNPVGNVTRAEAATIIYRVYNR